MNRDLVITSVKNPRVQAALALEERRGDAGRAATGRFLLEGEREIARALAAGLAIKELFVCSSRLGEGGASLQDQAAQRGAAMISINESVFAKLARREDSGGLAAVFVQRHWTLSELGTHLDQAAAPLLVAVQGIEKPGNLGALLRVADGAGANAVVILDQALDLYNPNVLRASLGTAFARPVVGVSSLEFDAWRRGLGLKVFAAALADRSVTYTAADFAPGGVVILLGEEAKGLTAEWLAAADQLVRIPMAGIADSLNVATAGAVLLYEAVRQRAARA